MCMVNANVGLRVRHPGGSNSSIGEREHGENRNKMPITRRTFLISRKYPMGLYSVGNMLLYTNRGLGMLPPQFRFNCRPEIALMDLYSS